MYRVMFVDATTGMVLHTPLLSPDGTLLLAAGHVLTEGDLAVLGDAPQAEIEVEDALAVYTQARPMFAVPTEAAALQALNGLIMLHPGLDQPVQLAALQKLLIAIDGLVESGFANADGSMDLAGPDTLQGHDYVHPIKAMELCIVLGQRLGMTRIEVTSLAPAAALMNIGYAALRRSLLDEPRGLEEHEWRHQVEMHPEYSVRILAEAGLTDEAVEAIAQHHERWDGSGYPHGLKATDIAPFARVIAVADTYVSLRSRRAYRNALSHADAIELLNDGADEFFDPDLVRAFIDVTSRLAPARPAVLASAAEKPSARPTEDDAAAQREQGRNSASAEYTTPVREDGGPGDEAPAPGTARRREATVTAEMAGEIETSAPANSPGTSMVTVASPPASAALTRRQLRARGRRRAEPGARSLWAPRFYLDTQSGPRPRQ